MSRESDLATLVTQAQQAFQGGQTIFIARLKTGAFSQPGFGEVESWEEMVLAVERLGWVLAHWSTSTDASSNVSAYPVFRRATPGHPQDRL